VDRVVTPFNDGFVEGPETVIATLVDGPQYDVGEPGTATITIADNPTPVITVTAVDANASEIGPDPGAFRFTRVGDPTFALSVTVTFAGTASNGGDYAFLSAVVTFPAGQSAVDRVVTPFNDGFVEGPETVIATLVDGPQYDVGEPGVATITIADNPTPVITVTAVDANASEIGPDPGTFRFTRVGDPTFALSVTVTFAGTASNGGDYEFLSAVVTFAAGQSAVDRVVTPFNDGFVEGPETVIATLVDGPQYDVGEPGTATITIADNPTPVITVTAVDANASEIGPDPGAFRFTRVGDPTFALSVTVTFAGTASNGGDYAFLSAVVTFPAGQSAVDRVVTPFNDGFVEGPETVIATLVDGPQYDVGEPGVATITIADNPTPVITVTAVDANASEIGPDPGAFRFTRVGDPTFALSVTVTFAGTASNGGDYAFLSAVVTFPAGQSAVDRVVTPFNDGFVEGPETVIATLVDADQYDLGDPSTATITIVDTALTITTDLNEALLFGTPGPALTATGGRGSLVFTIDSGALPRGVTLATSGQFIGSTMATGAFSFVARVTDCSPLASCPAGSTPQSATRAYTLNVSAVDQSTAFVRPSTNDFVFGGPGGRRIAQHVTTGVTGTLRGVRITAFACAAGTTLSLEVQGVAANGGPDGVALATGSAVASADTIVLLGTRLSFDSDQPFTVVIQASAQCTVHATPQNSYVGGDGYIGLPWQPLVDFTGSAFDVPLQTLVQPANGLSYTA